MRRIRAAVVSAAMALCTLTAIPANAADQSYSPKLYMTPASGEGYDILGGGKVYINKSALTSDTIELDGSVYISDERNYAGLVFVKWYSSSDDIRLTEIVDPITLMGAAPYAQFTSPSQINKSTSDKNTQGVGYALNTVSPYSWTGKKSDEYPLAMFKSVIKKDIAPGEYKIDFISEGSNKCNILYRHEDGSVSEAFPAGKYIKGIKIAVSDRMLGDIDGSKKHEAYDASLVLTAYTQLSAGRDSGLDAAQLAAADVDGDGRVTAADASYILSYYTYLAGTKERVTIAEFIANMK